MLFSKAVEMYWEDKSKRLRGNTLEGYASALRCHVLPAWGDREVESILRPHPFRVHVDHPHCDGVAVDGEPNGVHVIVAGGD